MVDDDQTPLPPAKPSEPDPHLPTGHTPRLRRVAELRIVTPFGSFAELADAWGRDCDGESLVVFTGDVREAGERALVTIVLESGEQALGGTCEVVESHADGHGPYGGRPAMRLRFLAADATTRARLEEMGAAASAVAAMSTMKLAVEEPERGTTRLWRFARAGGGGTVKMPSLAELAGLPRVSEALATQKMSIGELRAVLGNAIAAPVPDDVQLTAVVVDRSPPEGMPSETLRLPRLRELARIPPPPRAFWLGMAAGAALVSLLSYLLP